jgi:hypothetical protein
MLRCPNPIAMGLGTVTSSGHHARLWWSTNLVAAARATDGTRHLGFSTPVDVLWMPPDQEERAE